MDTLRLFNKDSKGVALSLDILIALIPITIMLGLVTSSMGNIMYETHDALYRSSNERVAADVANTLLKTSGDPYDWETNPASLKTLGWAKYDYNNHLPIEYVLMPQKVGASSPSLIQNLLGSQYGFLLTITSVPNGSTIVNMTSSCDTNANFNNASDVVKVERLVLVSAFDIVAEFHNIRLQKGGPITLEGNFPTSRTYLDMYDYYVYVDNSDLVSSGFVEINDVGGKNQIVRPSDFPSTPPLVRKIDPVTQKLKNQTNLQSNKVETELRGSPGDVADVYIIQVPKGTPEGLINPHGPQRVRAMFNLYVWTK